jgi:hypothetical protein
MYRLPYPGAASLDDRHGLAVDCRDAQTAATLSTLIDLAGQVVRAVEDGDERRLVRAQIALIKAWRAMEAAKQ